MNSTRQVRRIGFNADEWKDSRARQHASGIGAFAQFQSSDARAVAYDLLDPGVPRELNISFARRPIYVVTARLEIGSHDDVYSAANLGEHDRLLQRRVSA